MSTWRERVQRNAELSGAGTQEQEREEGASSPFYSESGTSGCCQVTVGQSLEEMNANTQDCGFCVGPPILALVWALRTNLSLAGFSRPVIHLRMTQHDLPT